MPRSVITVTYKMSAESHAPVLLSQTHIQNVCQIPMPQSCYHRHIQNVCSPVITDSCIQNVCRIPCLSPVITDTYKMSAESHAQVCYHRHIQNVCRVPCPGLLSQTHTKCLQNPMPRSVITDTYKMSAESHAQVCYHRHIQNVCRIPCPGLLSQTHTKCLQNPMPRSVITDTYKMSAESHAQVCYHRHIQNVCRIPCLSYFFHRHIQNVCRIPCPGLLSQIHTNVCRIPRPSPVITDTYKMSAESHAPVLLSQTHTKCLQNPMPRFVITDTYKMSAESHALLSQPHTTTAPADIHPVLIRWWLFSTQVRMGGGGGSINHSQPALSKLCNSDQITGTNYTVSGQGLVHIGTASGDKCGWKRVPWQVARELISLMGLCTMPWQHSQPIETPLGHGCAGVYGA